MAAVHVMEYVGASTYRFVLHAPVPAGTNAVGVSWKTCYLASFLPKTPVTGLPIGNGPGQISQNEANDISSGNIMEFDENFNDDPGADITQRNAFIDTSANAIKANRIAEFQDRFRVFGYTRP
jgi:hypothetical protein